MCAANILFTFSLPPTTDHMGGADVEGFSRQWYPLQKEQARTGHQEEVGNFPGERGGRTRLR